MAYLLPRDAYLLFEEAFKHYRAKAEVFAHAIETSITAIQDKAGEHIIGGSPKSEMYNKLRAKLATKEFVRAEVNGLRDQIHQVMGNLYAEMKQQGLLLKILIGLAIFGLTLFNPAFVKLVELLKK
jgi:hypothetical protein